MGHAVTLYDAAGLVIGHVDESGRRHMLRPDPVKPAKPEPTFFDRAARCARMFKVSPAYFTDAAIDDAADRSIARQQDAEARRRMNAELQARDEAAW
jgi:hypothetical protein